MAFPAVKVEVAFGSSATTAWSTGTDLTARVRQLSITRGRNYELDRVETGTCRVVFENRDAALDPTNTSSPYYPNVKPMKRIRVSAVWNAVTYQLFNGFVESWPPARTGVKDSETTVDCIDVFATLQQFQLSQFYGWNYAGDRITQVLDDAGWPSADRIVDFGASRMADADFTENRVPALEHLQAVAESEVGVIFADGTGRFCFHDRNRRRTATASKTVQAIFGNIPGTLAYTGLGPSYDAAHIYNDVSITVPGDDMQATADDPTSQADYWIRSLSRSTELYSWDEANSQADYLIARYKDPLLRADQITLKPGPIGDIWPHALGREISDRIQVKYQPPGTPTPPLLTQDAFIEGITHEAAGLKWTTTWQLSAPAGVDNLAVFIIGDATLGRIGSTNRLVY